MRLITRDELRRKLEHGEELQLVMTMPAFAYRTKHIPTSRRLEPTEDSLAKLDPKREVVVYCASPYCAASIYAYYILERRGYLRVRRYAGGIADWEQAGYSLETGSHREVAPAPARPRRRRRAEALCA